jgi:hypothetical protein
VTSGTDWQWAGAPGETIGGRAIEVIRILITDAGQGAIEDRAQ